MTDTQTVARPTGQKSPPQSLQLRPYAGEADLPVVVALFNRALEHDGVPRRWQLGDAKAQYSHPNDKFDPARDVTIAELDGNVVGFCERSWVDTALEEIRDYRIDGAVLPEWQRRGIGTAMLVDSIERTRERARAHDTKRDRFAFVWTNDRQVTEQAMLRSLGFESVRWFFDMARDLSRSIPEVPLPAGFEIREVTGETMIRQVWDADTEAFQDHWGGSDSSDESLRRFLDDPNLDPSLWVIAWDGDEIAGGVINAIETEENEMLGLRQGWLHSVFTRRRWRRRGLAKALIARSLVKIRDRAMDTGILGVDADNPTGALGLYERNGFVVTERSTAWRKPLDIGDSK
jgi:mycothiol synthase